MQVKKNHFSLFFRHSIQPYKPLLNK
jgi:hypothetical protein